VKPTLVVLAAGVARRFGRLKQLEPVGPAGETLLDYGIHDGMRAGFGNVVIVIRHETEPLFRQHAAVAWPEVPVRFVFQEATTGGAPVRASRTKPWGTTQAVLAAEAGVHEPFAVMNADDFYGARSFGLVADHLSGPDAMRHFLLAGYPLASTLSDKGGVSRAVATVDTSGFLSAITEYTNVRRDGSHVIGERNGEQIALDPAALVSMNLWGFAPRLFPLLHDAFRAFLDRMQTDDDAECALPDALQTVLETGQASVRVVPAPDEWLGITWGEDCGFVQERIRRLVEQEIYPSPLRVG
jgi:dTDP-glucose pyrophosphorylase